MVHRIEFPFPIKTRAFPWRKLLDYELIFMEEGEGILEFANLPVRLSRNGLYLIQPGRPHRATFGPGKNLYMHFDLFYHPERARSRIKPWGQSEISVNEEILLQPDLDRRLKRTIPAEVVPRDPERVAALFRDSLSLFSKMAPGWELLIQPPVVELLKYFLGDREPPARTGPAGNTLNERLSRVLLFLQSNLQLPVTLSDLSKVSSISPYYLCRLFRKRFGCGPVQYHHRLRMNEAARRLLETGAPVKNVGQDLGMENPYVFSRAFKIFFGESPKAYRARVRSV